MASKGGPGTYRQLFQFNAEVLGKENVDQLNRGLEITAQRLKASDELFTRMSGGMKQFTDQGLRASEAIQKIKKGLEEGDTAGRGFLNQLQRVLRELRELDNQNRPPNPNNPSPGGGSGSIFGRIGGRILGAEVLGKMGIPGGGFIGSQLAGGMGAGAGLLAAGAAVFAGYEIIKHTNDTLAYAQAQRNLANEIGITVSQMDTLSRVSEITGIKLEGSAKAVSDLHAELVKGGARAREIKDALSSLGLGTETAFMSSSESMKAIAEALSHIEDRSERTRIAIQLLGESAGRALAAASGNFKDMSEKLHVDDDTLRRLATAKDHINEMWEKVSRKWLITIDTVLTNVTGGNTTVSQSDWDKLSPKDQERLKKLGVTVSKPESDQPSPELADRQNANLNYITQRGIASSDPGERYRAKMDDIALRERKFKDQATGSKASYVSQHNIDVALGKFESERLAAEEEKKRSVQYRNQVEEFERFKKTPFEPSSVFKRMAELSRFDLLLNNPEFTKYRGELLQFALKPRVGLAPPGFVGPQQHYYSEFELSQLRMLQREGFAPEGGETESKYEKKSHEELARRDKELLRGSLADRRLSDSEIEEATKDIVGEKKSNIPYEASQSTYRRTVQSGFPRYGLTPAQIASRELEISQGYIQDKLNSETSGMRSERDFLRVAAGMMRANNPLSDKAIGFEEDAKKLDVEILTKETEARTKSVEAIIKFNDSIDKAAEEVRNQFSSGITSIIMGAQHGHGGAANAAKGFLEQQESRMLQNIIGQVLYGSPKTKAGGVLQKIGNTLPPWMTQGTIFQHVDEKKPLTDNTDATKDNTKATENLTKLLSGSGSGSGGGGGSANASAGSSAMGIPLGGPGGSSGAITTADDITKVADIATGLSTIATGSAKQDLSAVSSALNKVKYLSSGFAAGMSLTGSKSFGILFGGQGATASVKAGAVAGDIMAGLAAYQGISTMTKGGAKNVTGGLSETLAAAGMFTGPAMPFVEAAAAVAGLVSAFLPDNRQTRANEISKRIFTDQYLAPAAMNLTESAGGGYSDFDIFGNVRTSNLSPYPQSHMSYLDVPRRTVVPGSTYSQFGGPGNIASALTPAPTYNVVIHALDSQSILNRSRDIVDAFHKGIKSDPGDVVNTLGQQMGLR